MSNPSLATRARRVLERERIPRGARILIACSGGPDSQALLDTLAHVGKKGRLVLFAHGVDHGLRPEASRELDHAKALAMDLGVPFSSTKVQVEKGSNIMARARDVRYQALYEAALGCDAQWIATAHHRDDLAETVLIRILRGAPLEGLAVLPAKSQRFPECGLLRPLIEARRSDIEFHVRKRDLVYASDPSNQNTKYLRVKIRKEILPLLKETDPRIVDHLSRLAEEAVSIFKSESKEDE